MRRSMTVKTSPGGRARSGLPLLLPVVLLLVGCEPGEEGPCGRPEVLEAAGSRLVYCDGGWLDLETAEGQVLVRRAVGAVMLDATDWTGRSLRTDGPGRREARREPVSDALGEGERLVVRVEGGDAGLPDLLWTITAYGEGGFYTFGIALDNQTGETVELAKASPVLVRAEEGGGLFLGGHPSRHRILENGSYTVLDFVVDVVPGDVERSSVLRSMVEGDLEGHSVSNWNHAVVDLDGPAAWVAGGLSFERSIPLLELGYDPDEAPEAEDGRRGFSFFAAEAAYAPVPRPVASGESLDSELYYIHPTEADALAGLELYAERVAAHLEVVPWTRRDGGRRVPNGWNSWSGSGSSGGYGTDIDEDLILENLDVMATELRDWGMDWFQIDDGYEPAYGDWVWREDRFPHGPTWLADQIRARGLRPGLWIAPFSPGGDSNLVAEHPEWMADWTPFGEARGGESHPLDLTHPEVREHIRELFRTFHDEWGFEWLKMDFAYLALMGTGFYDPTQTREEAWRAALEIIREEVGEETFFLLVGTIGINYGLVDAGRTTLDSMPVWDWQPDAGPEERLAQQGLKPTVRAAARRWYLQDRLWMNHPDLIFFRSNPLDETWPRLTLEESQAFCTFVGLSGGIVKLGDRLVDLDADAINSIRQILPTYGRAARPLDLFAREFPEVYSLPVDEPTDGYDEAYELIGLFNWGFNFDMTESPYAEMPDDGSDREHEVDLGALGITGERLAYEFWTEELLGVVEDRLTETVPAHAARLIALRPVQGVPQFLGWNRQMSMGGTLLEEVSWQGGERRLHLRAQVAAPTATAPFTYSLAFYAPAGFTLSDSSTSGVEVDGLEARQEGEVVRVRFVPQATGRLELDLAF